MTGEFRDFIKIVRHGIASGEIRITKEMTDFDLAVQYAIGKIGEKRGYPCDVTPEEIQEQIMIFAPELIDS